MRISVAFLSLIFVASVNQSKNPDWMVKDPDITIVNIPIFPENDNSDHVKINFEASNINPGLELSEIRLIMASGSSTGKLAKITVRFPVNGDSNSEKNVFGSSSVSSRSLKIIGKNAVLPGINSYVASFTAKNDVDPSGFIKVESVSLRFSDGAATEITPSINNVLRFGRILREAGQDNADTYRIPGLVTTNNGTLIAVYDIRQNSSRDLQENIDIGMSRSTDHGQTWEPMKVIMDMGEYGGLPENQNGIGDPCILYDSNSGTIWVAALWMSGLRPGQTLWFGSNPGLMLGETGQLMLVKSTDDGITWSKPVSVTEQVKDPSWQLLFQGPGRGIIMKDGTLVFPAQFKADIGEKAIDGGKYTCHSTIVFSSDGGKSWKIGTGAKANTTEAQVVELSDGSLMLNMRDDRNRKDKTDTNGRAVAVTRDMGKTWQVHPSSNSALPEPNCMASLISAEIRVSGEMKPVLFFSNPNDRTKRSKMTIKTSLDEGLTWPVEYQVELFENEGFGYSCLTMVDENTLGILYEGTKDLFFQKISVPEIIKKK